MLRKKEKPSALTVVLMCFDVHTNVYCLDIVSMYQMTIIPALDMILDTCWIRKAKVVMRKTGVPSQSKKLSASASSPSKKQRG